MMARAGLVERSAAVVGAVLPAAFATVLALELLAGEGADDAAADVDDEAAAGAGVAAETAETGVSAVVAYAAIN